MTRFTCNGCGFRITGDTLEEARKLGVQLGFVHRDDLDLCAPCDALSPDALQAQQAAVSTFHAQIPTRRSA